MSEEHTKELELLPCPFCGDGLIEVRGNEWEEDLRATCIGCLSASSRYRTRAEAVKAWNSRASVAAPQGDASNQPLCAVHQRLEDIGALECEVGNDCVACSLNERCELLALIGPFAADGNTEDSVTVLRRVAEFYATHVGDDRVVVSYPATASLPPATPSLIPEQGPRLLTTEELAEIERFQRQRRKNPVAADAWLYVAEIDRLLTHIRLDREQLENEIFQDATDPTFATQPSARVAAEIPRTTYKNKRQLSDDERFKLNSALNDYLFNNCDHEHDGYPNHLACRWCALEIIAAISFPSVQPVEEQKPTNLQRAIAEHDDDMARLDRNTLQEKNNERS